MIFFRSLSFIVLILFLSACTPKIAELSATKQVSLTKLPKSKSALLHYLNKTDKKLGKKSAFYSLDLPTNALAARFFLIDNATTSLDVQYYIYENDSIGEVFSAHLLLAAQRGVRVRILLDDLSTAGKDDKLQKLALHPNVELRLFNPNKLRKSFRNIAMLMNLDSLGKRMHNKSLIADGSVAIIGGRNIGDVYFAATTKTLFLDYDILCIGSVVPQISKAFDIFWNSEQAVPSSEVLGSKYTDFQHIKKEFIQTLKQQRKTFDSSRLGKAVINSNFSRRVKNHKLILTVAKKTHFFYDMPSKVNRDENNVTGHISQQISKDLKKAHSNVMIISPYFIPSDEMLTHIKTLRKSGVEVSIITNSLASTDVFPVYAGYKDYIKPLLKMGVKLYELKPDSFQSLIKSKKVKKVPNLSLHTKMILVDNKKLAVGSANIDPRSDKLNTELFMVIISKKLTGKQQKYINKVINLENLYELNLTKHPKNKNSTTKTDIMWKTIEDGKIKYYYSEPKVGFFKKLGTDMVSILPIKGYL